jgi:cysteinyl-tRNA synthetase
MGQFPPGRCQRIHDQATAAMQQMREALEDDLNTAQALAAIFNLVRETNTAADNNQLRQDDKAPLLAALKQFDEIFDVLKDDDAAKINHSLEWARAQGKLAESDLPPQAITDEEVERLMADRASAKKSRDFARADAIRTQLSEAGILVEDTKEGIRWKRK